MTYRDAFDEARRVSAAENVTVYLLHDPLGAEDWEEPAESYGYCSAAYSLTLFRGARVVITFHPAPAAVAS